MPANRPPSRRRRILPQPWPPGGPLRRVHDAHAQRGQLLPHGVGSGKVLGGARGGAGSDAVGDLAQAVWWSLV
jgi:hypothetical protein